MRYKYTKFTGGDLEGLDLEELLSKLSNLLLSSGFDSPYGDPSDEDGDRSVQSLHDAILDAILRDDLLPKDTIEQLLGDPADGDSQTPARGAHPANHRAYGAARLHHDAAQPRHGA